MHLGETLLVLGSLLIFSLTTLHLNNAKIGNSIKLMESEFQITGVGIAQSFIEESQTMKFDEAVLGGTLSNVPDDFTNTASLGPDAGETYPNFDDVDDFNDFTENITTPRASFDVEIHVQYADTAQCTPTLNKSLHKIMIVAVKSDFFQDSIVCSYLFSFY